MGPASKEILVTLPPTRVFDPEPHLEVTVRMTRTVRGALPTGFAGTIFAGWRRNSTPLTHVRLTVQAIDVHNPLKPVVPIAPKTCSATGPACSTDGDCTDPERPSCTFLGGTSKVCQRPCDVTGDCRPPTCASCGTSETCLGQGPVTDWASAARSDAALYGRFFHAMLKRGVYLAPSQFEAIFVSLAHTPELIDQTIEAARGALTESKIAE